MRKKEKSVAKRLMRAIKLECILGVSEIFSIFSKYDERWKLDRAKFSLYVLAKETRNVRRETAREKEK